MLTSFFGFNTTTDFLYKVGKGQIDSREFKKFKLSQAEQSKTKSKPKSLKEVKTLQRKKVAKEDDDDILFIGEDLDVFDFKIAACCNPIPGDDVFGFVTVSDGTHEVSKSFEVEVLEHHNLRNDL